MYFMPNPPLPCQLPSIGTFVILQYYVSAHSNTFAAHNRQNEDTQSYSIAFISRVGMQAHY